ncbi:MAG: hypothetical protein ABL951_02575 [Alphaproteobacteria bacterium]
MEWIIARLREPSTIGGLSALFGLVGVTWAPELQEAIVAVAVSVGGLLMILMREKSD